MRDDDQAAEFVEFTRAHRRDLMRTASLLCAGDEGHAEDLVQTTLVKLYLAWARVRRADSPLAYARTSLTHHFIDEARRAHRRREVTSGVPAEALPRDLVSTGTDVELREVMLAALSALGPRQRAVVVLRHWLDLDVAETARILGCSTGTVKSQNARALAHLRARLDITDHSSILEDTT